MMIVVFTNLLSVLKDNTSTKLSSRRGPWVRQRTQEVSMRQQKIIDPSELENESFL